MYRGGFATTLSFDRLEPSLIAVNRTFDPSDLTNVVIGNPDYRLLTVNFLDPMGHPGISWSWDWHDDPGPDTVVVMSNWVEPFDHVHTYSHITYTAIDATLTISEGTTVPEPSTLLLLASGLAGMGGVTWRRRRS